MQSQKGIWVALVAVAIIAVAALGIVLTSNSSSPSFGGVTNYDEVDATAIKVGGTNGTRIGLFAVGQCSLIAPSFTFAASTSVAVDCAVNGVQTGDIVDANFATSSAVGAGWLVTGASASSTSGFITLRVVNNTGASAVIPASIASTTDYTVLRPRSTVPGL